MSKHTPGPWEVEKFTLVVNHEIRTQIANVNGRDAQERAANACLIAAAPEQLETLRSDAAFLRHYLANYVVHVATKDERGHVVNGFAAVQIPDWAVKQRLDDIHAAIAKAEGLDPESTNSSAAPQPDNLASSEVSSSEAVPFHGGRE